MKGRSTTRNLLDEGKEDRRRMNERFKGDLIGDDEEEDVVVDFT